MIETSPKPALAWPGWIQDGHSGVWLRLRHLLETSDGFSLIIVVCEDHAYQQKLITQLNQEYGHQHIIDAAISDLDFMEALYHYSSDDGAIHLTGTQHWFKDDQHLDAAHRINYQREKIASSIKIPLILWLHDAQVNAFAHAAPDAWAWRTAVLDFSTVDVPLERIHNTSISISINSDKDATSRNQRLQEISAYLDAKAEHGVADILLLLEQSRLFKGLGRLNESDRSAKRGLTLSGEFDDKRHAAMAYGQIADILKSRGNLDEALRIREEEQLPVYEQLGDVREKAICLGKIADILQSRGNLDEALRIREEEEIPVYEQLGDVRSLLVGRVNVAMLLSHVDATIHQQQIESLFTWSLIAAIGMQLAEVNQIAEIMRKADINLPDEQLVQSSLQNFSLDLTCIGGAGS